MKGCWKWGILVIIQRCLASHLGPGVTLRSPFSPIPPAPFPVGAGGATSPAATRHPLPMGEGCGFADAHRCAR